MFTQFTGQDIPIIHNSLGTKEGKERGEVGEGLHELANSGTESTFSLSETKENEKPLGLLHRNHAEGTG